MKLIHTITNKDVGKIIISKTCLECGLKQSFCLLDVLGRIMSFDVGKRIYKTSGGILQVENEEQLNARLGAEARIFTFQSRHRGIKPLD